MYVALAFSGGTGRGPKGPLHRCSRVAKEVLEGALASAGTGAAALGNGAIAAAAVCVGKLHEAPTFDSSFLPVFNEQRVLLVHVVKKPS